MLVIYDPLVSNGRVWQPVNDNRSPADEYVGPLFVICFLVPFF